MQSSPRFVTPSVPRNRGRGLAKALIATLDAAAILAAVMISGVAPWWGGCFAATALVVLALRGHYRLRITPSLTEEAGPLVACLAVPLVLVAVVAGHGTSLPQLLRAGIGAAVLVLAARATTYRLLRRARARGWLEEPTLVIGAGPVAAEVVRVLQDHREYGLTPVGFLDSCEEETDLPAPLLGPLAWLGHVLEEHAVRRVIIAFGVTPDPDMVRIVRTCDRQSVEIHVLPRFFELGFEAYGTGVDKIWGLPLLRVRRSVLRTGVWSLKRWVDVAVSGIGLAVLAPLYGAISLAVRLSSPGPVLFRQQRVGQDGRLINVLKFRTMLLNGDSDTTWSVEGDDRVTAVGRILRRSCLDELPQLLNVLRGDMSLVGPRPERPCFVQHFRSEIAAYEDRHRVRPGITGSAQVHGLRGDTSIAQRTRFDNQYIENWSLWQDVVIIARTIRLVLTAGPSPARPSGAAHEMDSPATMARAPRSGAPDPAAAPARAVPAGWRLRLEARVFGSAQPAGPSGTSLENPSVARTA